MRRQVAALFAGRLMSARRAVRQADWAQIAVASVYILIGIAFVVGAYRMFVRGYAFILAEPLVGPLILRYVLELAFALVFFLGIISFIVSSFGLLFRNRGLRLLGAMPVPPLALFIYAFTGALLLSSWPVLVLAVPALAALGAALGANAAYYLFCAAVLVLFICAIAVAGGLLSFAVAPFVSKISSGWLAIMEMAVFGALSLSFIRSFMSREIFGMFNVDTPAAAALVGERLDALFVWTPSHYAVRLVSSVLPYGETASPMAGLFAAAGVLAVAAALLMAVARQWYFSLWQTHHETGFLAKPEDVPYGRVRRPFPRFLRWRHGFLFEKEILILLRSPGEISRASFLGLLLFFYILSARALAAMEAFSRADLFSWVVAFAFAAIGYFALTFGMRFVFPSPSIEGKSAWVLWSSPVHIHESYSWKFFFWSLLLLAVLETASALVTVLFKLPLPLGQFLAFAVFCTVLPIVAITLGQGTLFPNFREQDPDRLATSPAGLSAALLGLLFVWVVTRYVRQFTLAFLESGRIDTLAMFGILVVSIAITGIYWALSVRAADRTELL